MTFAIGDRVTWRSQSGGSSTEKVGIVAAYVPPGERPSRLDFPELHKGVGCGYARGGESWVVRVGRRGYWPVAKNLRLVDFCPHCDGSGIATKNTRPSAQAVAVDDAMLAFVADQLAGQLGDDSGHVETLLRKAFGLQPAMLPIAGITHGTDEGGGDE